MSAPSASPGFPPAPPAEDAPPPPIWGRVAEPAPVPVPGTPPGSHLPGVLATGARHRDGRIVAITRLAYAAPGKPDGEVDTRPLRPIWWRAEPAWREPWRTPAAPERAPGAARETVPEADLPAAA